MPINCGTRGRPLLAKPDWAGLPPGQTTNGAGHGGRGIVCGCPLATARVRCEWHGSGTAGEDDGGGASQRRHQVDRRVRPVPETPDLLASAYRAHGGCEAVQHCLQNTGLEQNFH
jgi:hypothetical protein